MKKLYMPLIVCIALMLTACGGGASRSSVEKFSQELREREDLRFVWEAVKQLPENCREVIHLFYQEGCSTREIAAILHRNESTVRSDLKRGRDRLRRILKEDYDFEEGI